MIFDTIFAGIDGFSYCMEMLIACMLFHVYLKKRQQFWLRLILSAAVLFILSILVYPLIHGENLWFSCIWYGLIYLTMVAVSRFCCEISWQDAIYCASCGYLVQHLASSVFILCIFNGSIPVWNGPVYPVKHGAGRFADNIVVLHNESAQRVNHKGLALWV